MANVKRIILEFTDDSPMTHEDAMELCDELAEKYECECTIEGELLMDLPIKDENG